MATQRPQTTAEQLCEIFPNFRVFWHYDERPAEDGLVDRVYYKWMHHEVSNEFLTFFSKNYEAFTEKQLCQFGTWIDKAIFGPTSLENAVSTCFLEHARQTKISRVLAPYLSRETKRRYQARSRPSGMTAF